MPKPTWEAAPRRDRPAAHRRHRRHRDAAHLHLRRRRRHPPGRHRQARCPATGPTDPRTTTATPAPDGSPGGWPSSARPAAATSTTSARRNYVSDGWNVTGDTFVRDEDGYFCYQARTDNMIVSSGYNIGGPEVEAAIDAAPGRRRVRGRRPARTPSAARSSAPSSCCATGVVGDAAKAQGDPGLRQGRPSRRTSTRATSASSTRCRATPAASSSTSGCASVEAAQSAPAGRQSRPRPEAKDSS